MGGGWVEYHSGCHLPFVQVPARAGGIAATSGRIAYSDTQAPRSMKPIGRGHRPYTF
jgi:hypothetical protein